MTILVAYKEKSKILLDITGLAKEGTEFEINWVKIIENKKESNVHLRMDEK